MAHFARLNEDNIVTEVLVIGNQDILDENGQESEEVGIQFCKKLFGETTNWIQTSYNNSFRKRFAGIGSRYLSDKDIFTTAPLFPSWVYNEELDQWEAPIPKPEDGENYTWIWDEEFKSWKPYYRTLEE